MKGLMIFADNMEDAESIFTRDLLLRANLFIDTVSIKKDKNIRTAYGLSILADKVISEINESDYDFLVVPGGKYVSETIETDVVITSLIKQFNDNKKLVAAICAAPMFLKKANVLNELSKYTCFPGCEKYIDIGQYKKNEKTVTYENIITARSVAATIAFSYDIVVYLLGETMADILLANIVF